MSGDVTSDLTRYRDGLVRWGLASEALETRRANAPFDEAHELFKLLRDDPEGRCGISALMADPDPYVRLNAATHSLGWSSHPAVETLNALQADASSPPFVCLTAEVTLEEWRAGRLSLDW